MYHMTKKNIDQVLDVLDLDLIVDDHHGDHGDELELVGPYSDFKSTLLNLNSIAQRAFLARLKEGHQQKLLFGPKIFFSKNLNESDNFKNLKKKLKNWKYHKCHKNAFGRQKVQKSPKILTVLHHFDGVGG